MLELQADGRHLGVEVVARDVPFSRRDTKTVPTNGFRHKRARELAVVVRGAPSRYHEGSVSGLKAASAIAEADYQYRLTRIVLAITMCAPK
jgi:hypothetical protein